MASLTSADTDFWDNLDVFRSVLIRILIYFAVGFILWVALVPHLFDTFILGPCRADFPSYRLLDRVSELWGSGSSSEDANFPIRLVNIKLGSQFFIHMRVALALSLLTIFPLILMEVWFFLKPALYPSESKSIRFVMWMLPLLFYAGCAVGYWLVFPLSLRFLIFYDLGDFIESKVSLESYMSNFFTLTFAMGVVFLLPLAVLLLSLLGILRRSTLRKARRYAVVILMVMAAIITPGGDPVTMMIVFTPLYMLYEISILFVRKDSLNTLPK